MKAQLIFAGIVASAVTAAAAQYPPARPEQKPEQQQKQQAQTVTVTGCLQPASAATSEPTQPQREPGSSEQQFVLAQAKVTAGPTSTAGATGTSGTLASADKFRLIGGKPVELKEHLNHRVEITGTLQPRSERGQQKGAGVDPQKKPADEANLPALRVTGFKHIAESCGPESGR